MTKAEELYHKIASSLPDAKESKMFGAQCIKAPNGKAAAMFHSNEMVFKLEGDDLTEALSLEGAHLFDPMGGRPMGGWVQLSYKHAPKWKSLAEKSMAYVKALKK